MLRIFAGLVVAVSFNGSALAYQASCEDYLGHWVGVCKEEGSTFESELYIDTHSGKCLALAFSRSAANRERSVASAVGVWHEESYLKPNGDLFRRESIVGLNESSRLQRISLVTRKSEMSTMVEKTTESFELSSQDVLRSTEETVLLGAEEKRKIQCSYDRQVD